MRKILQSLALLVASACTSPTTTLKPTKQVKPTIEQRVQQEVRKMDPFVEWYVQSDYTQSKNTFTSFALVDNEEMQEMNQKGSGGSMAAYIGDLDLIKIPTSRDLTKNEKLESGIGIAIIHEVAHAITDDIKLPGIIYWNGYTGPNEKEIKFFMDDVSQREELEPLRKEIKRKIKFIKTKQKVKNNTIVFTKRFNESTKSIDDFRRFALKDEYLFDYLRKSETNILIDTFRELKQTKKKLDLLLSDYAVFLKSFDKDGDLDKFGKEIDNYTKELETYIPFTNKARDFQESYGCFFQAANKRKLFKYMKNEILKSKETNKEKEEVKLDYSLTLVEVEEQIITCLRYSHIGTKNDSIEEELRSSIVKSVISQKSNQDFLGDYEEVFARIVASMYQVYLEEEPTTHNFKLKQQDLEFLSQFEYQGKQLFKKGVEKYQVALDMLEDGQAPKQVQATLNQATDFEYKGKTYCWHNNHFTINGKIPKTDY